MKQQSKQTVLALANATTLASGIVGQLMGSRLTNTLGGSPATQKALSELISTHLQKKIGARAAMQTNV